MLEEEQSIDHSRDPWSSFFRIVRTLFQNKRKLVLKLFCRNSWWTSRATVRFMVRTRAASGRRASATLSMKVGSWVFMWRILSIESHQHLGKYWRNLSRPEEDDRSQNYQSCSYQGQADLEKSFSLSNVFLWNLAWIIHSCGQLPPTFAVYWASLMAALPMDTAILLKECEQDIDTPSPFLLPSTFTSYL